MIIDLSKNDSRQKLDELKNTKGFITIATGSEKYYKLAYFLLMSYRMTTTASCRFGVLTDSIGANSSWLKIFDDIIILENPKNSYMDKVTLLINSPYGENIFIDSDCIAFNDLNQYWDVFDNKGDFSCFGTLYPEDSKNCVFEKENMGKYRDNINYTFTMHGGIYYIRNSEKCRELFNVCEDLIKDYSNYKFKKFRKPADEPVIAAAMAICGCKPVQPERKHYAWFKSSNIKKADVFSKKLIFTSNGKSTDEGMLIHFGTINTVRPIYLIESAKIKYYAKNSKSWSVGRGLLTKSLLCIKGGFLCFVTAWKKLLKKLKI